jgi:hypothetical protein
MSEAPIIFGLKNNMEDSKENNHASKFMKLFLNGFVFFNRSRADKNF